MSAISASKNKPAGGGSPSCKPKSEAPKAPTPPQKPSQTAEGSARHNDNI